MEEKIKALLKENDCTENYAEFVITLMGCLRTAEELLGDVKLSDAIETFKPLGIKLVIENDWLKVGPAGEEK